MKRVIRRFLLVGLAALALTPGAARAQQPVFCVNCTTPAFQLPQWLQNFENQVTMIQYQINFWQTLIQNTVDLAEKPFADITNLIAQLQSAVQQADLLAQSQRFFIDHLSDPSGYGGDLSNIPAALAMENNALALAMTTMSQVLNASQQMQNFYAPQINTMQGIVPSGMTQAVQIGNQMMATQAQQQSVYMNAQTVSLQALATAELRKAHRETLLDTRALLDQENAVAAECGYIVNFSTPACSAPLPPVSGSGTGTTTSAASPPGFVDPTTGATIPGGTPTTIQPATSFVSTAG